MSENKKIALLIGINYTGTSAQLNGCQNDVIKIKEVIKSNYNYVESNITMLIDKQGYIQPIVSNIITALNSIYVKCKKEVIEEVFIYYSGHGSNVIDKDRDETDGKDECIIPLDYAKSGIITDDFIYKFLSQLAPVKKKIIWIFDSCNSASCTDLPYSFTLNNSNRVVRQNLSKRKPITNNKNIFVLSGCLDAKVSYDVREPDGTPCGLLSYNLRKTLEHFGYNCTIEQLLIYIKKGFGSNDQIPVLSVNSNSYGPKTIIFEKPIQTNTITTTIKPATSIPVNTIPVNTKPTSTQLEMIKQKNNDIKALYSDFNRFTNKSKTMTQEQINTQLDSFILNLEKITAGLKK